jgi:hypothetical protein
MRRRLAALGRGVILVALFARCVVLVAGWVGDGVTQQFLAADLERSMDVVSGAGGRLGQITAKAAPQAPADGGSLLGRLKDDMTTTWQQAQAWLPDRAAVDAGPDRSGDRGVSRADDFGAGAGGGFDVDGAAANGF